MTLQGPKKPICQLTPQDTPLECFYLITNPDALKVMNASFGDKESLVFSVSCPPIIPLSDQMMEDIPTDFTMTFRQLGEISLEQLGSGDIPQNLWALIDLQKSDHFSDWSKLYVAQFDPRKDDVDQERRRGMNGRCEVY